MLGNDVNKLQSCCGKGFLTERHSIAFLDYAFLNVKLVEVVKWYLSTLLEILTI